VSLLNGKGERLNGSTAFQLLARGMAAVGVPMATIIAGMAASVFLDLRSDVKKLVDIVTHARIVAAGDRQVLEEHERRIGNLERRGYSSIDR
jgi:hypothetical protein